MQPNPECPDRRRFSARCDSATSTHRRADHRNDSTTAIIGNVQGLSSFRAFRTRNRSTCIPTGSFAVVRYAAIEVTGVPMSSANPSHTRSFGFSFVPFPVQQRSCSTPFSCVGYISVNVETVLRVTRRVRVQTVKRPPKISNKTSPKMFTINVIRIFARRSLDFISIAN